MGMCQGRSVLSCDLILWLYGIQSLGQPHGLGSRSLFWLD